MTTNNTSWTYLVTSKVQSTLQASGIEWPILRNHIPHMAHSIQLAVVTFISNLGLKGRTKSWEAHEGDQQVRENESTGIGNSQRLRKEANARINRVSAMRPGLTNIIEKLRISIDFESPKTDNHSAESACFVDYADTWLSKRVHLLSTSQRKNWSPTNYRCEDMVEFDTGVVWATLLIMRIHPWVA